MRTPICLGDYVEWLDEGKPFVQANYGDGEWACILGHQGGNCNGESYIAPVQQALIDTLRNPPAGHVWYGSNPGRRLEPIVREWLIGEGLTQRAWVYKEIISGANVNGKLRPFIDAVRRRKTVVVGPSHLNNKTVRKIWDVAGVVKVPTADAYLAIERTKERTLTMIYEHEPEIVLVCSGMAANPLIFDMARRYPYITFIDMGATLDPYAGVWSRNAYRKPEFQSNVFGNNIKGLV